jgi:predicted transcriptional regulator
MMAVNEMLETNPRAAIAEIAKAYGVNLQGTSDEQNANPESPRIAELEARLARQEAHLTAQLRQQQQAEANELAREIADFAKDKPHFESVRKVMAGLMNSGAAETMQEAYDRAIYADPTIRQSLQVEAQTKAEEQRKAEEAKRLSAAKKAAGVNVKSSPGQANTARSLDDDLWAIARKAYGT